MITKEELDDFLSYVILMREWQKRYFTTRSSYALSRAMFFESSVDEKLKQLIEKFHEDKERFASRAKSEGLWPSE